MKKNSAWPTTMKNNPKNGFTVIEILVAIAITGILAKFAYPAYTTHIKNAKQAEARTALLSLANTLSQYYLDSNTYVGAAVGSGGIFTDTVPVSGGKKTYTLSLSNLTASTYTVTATPVDTSLETYTLNEIGQKTPTCNTTTGVGWC